MMLNEDGVGTSDNDGGARLERHALSGERRTSIRAQPR